MQTLVDKVLADELAASPEKYVDICQCPYCLAAVKAAALNELKPFYVTTVAGEVFGEYRHKELQNLSDVLVAVAKGVEALRAQDPNGHRPS